MVSGKQSSYKNLKVLSLPKITNYKTQYAVSQHPNI